MFIKGCANIKAYINLLKQLTDEINLQLYHVKLDIVAKRYIITNGLYLVLVLALNKRPYSILLDNS